VNHARSLPPSRPRPQLTEEQRRWWDELEKLFWPSRRGERSLAKAKFRQRITDEAEWRAMRATLVANKPEQIKLPEAQRMDLRAFVSRCCD
jgi:hypothetical protein